MRVVLDANQYVSAVLKPGSKPARLVELALKREVTILASEPILEEIGRVLAYPKLKKLHGLTAAEIKQYLEDIRRAAVITPAKLKLQAVAQDPSDDKYLACAVEGQADYIVSGDHHLKDIKEFQGIQILDPAAFLDLFK